MPTLPATCMSSTVGDLIEISAVSIFEINSCPWYICCERARDFGGGGAATVVGFDESHAARPVRTHRPAARITLRIGILPHMIASSLPTVALPPQARRGPARCGGSALG